MSKPLKQIHLAAHFPGVNNTTVWSDPKAGSHIEFSSFAHFARTAERARFDFLFLAEGLRLREQDGKIYDLDVVGRPDTFTVLAALAAVTEHLGLTGTINSTFNEPYEVARDGPARAAHPLPAPRHLRPGQRREVVDHPAG
ncbi:LLM class flavin-dependent oxidoreductase, partial [Streptomyces sp. NPDC001215]